MTVEQYFKLFPQAQKVLVVGEDLFHEMFAKSAQKVADAKKISVEVVTRPESAEGNPVPQAKAAKTKD